MIISSYFSHMHKSIEIITYIDAIWYITQKICNYPQKKYLIILINVPVMVAQILYFLFVFSIKILK